MPPVPATPDRDAPARRRATLVAAALIVVATVVAYLPAARGGFLWDDDAHVTRPGLRSLRGLGLIWTDLRATQQYYPLLHSAFWFEHRLWGDRTLGYHAVNVALHAGAAVLVLLIARRALRDKGAPWGNQAAVLTAAVFALHPVHTESVAWISEQKNTLSAVFYLGAMLVYLDFDESRRRGPYMAAAALFVCGLLTKTVTATLPAALLVIFWWRRGRLSWRTDAAPLLPWFIAGSASGLFTAWIEHNIIGAKGKAFDLSAAQRLMLAGRTVWFYLSKLLWPADLVFVYPRWTVNPAAWEQWLFPATLLGTLIALGAFARRRRAPLAALLFFAGTLFPVLGLFNVYPFLFSFVADHFQYLASLGVIGLVCAGMAIAASRIPSRAARATVLGAVPLVLGVLTFRQARMYSDAEALYETTIRRNPACWMAHNNLGILVRHQGRIDEAIGHYRRALELRPDYPEAHYNLGGALLRLGRADEAITEFTEAVRLRPDNPEALANLGNALSGVGRHGEAVEYLQRAVRSDPDNPGLRADLGSALQAGGRSAEAAEAFRRSLELNPDQPAISLQHDLALAGTLPPQDAVREYGRVLLADPGSVEARFGLAVCLAQTGRPEEAIVQYQEVVRARPDHLEAHNNLGAMLARAGRVAEAIPHLEKAASLRPDQVETHMNLAVAYASAGRFTEALASAGWARDLARASGPPDRIEKIDSWIASCRERAAAPGPK